MKPPTKRDVVRDVRTCFSGSYQIRKGFSYIGCRCIACGNLFQVPYYGKGHRYARRRLIDHVKTECRVLQLFG